jgi:hypothetical protein
LRSSECSTSTSPPRRPHLQAPNRLPWPPQAAPHLLYGYALLAEGSELPEPGRYNRLVGELMVKSL